jgi:hypothetical protein
MLASGVVHEEQYRQVIYITRPSTRASAQASTLL